uniref:acyl-coenzyme A thioesterase 11 isoform X2 n=1 Tax=Myxine glutinosa TaxID=7769 RepID=UPI00358FBB85
MGALLCSPCACGDYPSSTLKECVDPRSMTNLETLPACPTMSGEGHLDGEPVEMSQFVLPCHANHRGELGPGQLLKWMDITGCLAAEKHAGMLCVTASMDDINFEETIRVGQAVLIKAVVNRAFNTSLEVGISVRVDDVESGRQEQVCKAYSTFVVRRNHKQKCDVEMQVQLRAVLPTSSEEWQEHKLAAERRRMRLTHSDTLAQLLRDANLAIVPDRMPGEDDDGPDTSVPGETTRVQSVELVLPPHANHQGNTFGGQIMAWMETVASLAASRLCGEHATLRAIDMFQFRGPSAVGDRLTLRAIVNNSFHTVMEVGVCVEAWNSDDPPGPTRHINSAFLVYSVKKPSGELRTLPSIRPATGDGQRRYREAIARKKIRLERKFIFSCKPSQAPLSVPWETSNQAYLSYNNVSALTSLAGRGGWEHVSSKNGITLWNIEDGIFFSFRIQMEAAVPPEQAFLLLSDLDKRHLWDKHYQKCSRILTVDDDDAIFHVQGPAVARDEMTRDFVVLMSRRQPCDDGEPYLVAFRSVTLPAAPAPHECLRGEVQCAGFVVEPLEANLSQVSYFNQATTSFLPYISSDIAGLSDESVTHFQACRLFLEHNSKL